MFARYLLQDSGTSYGVVATIYRNKEQVRVQLVTGKNDKLQPIATSYSKLHGASKVIKKWRPHQQVFLNGFAQNVSNA